MKPLRIVSDKPEHQPKNFKWDWCFHCDSIHACCPRCDVNSCACGCVYDAHRNVDGSCPEQAWWDAQYGPEYQAEIESRPRPSRDKLIRFIDWMNGLKEEDRWQVDMACDLLRIVDHCRWHGLDFTFTMSIGDERNKWEKNWSLVINNLPVDEPREVYYPEAGKRYLEHLKKKDEE